VRQTAIHGGDIVFVNQRGRIFYAKIMGAGASGSMTVEPLDKAIRVRTVRAQDVVDHWARSRRGDLGPPVGQILLDELAGW
jgi:hypothetical protein